MSGGAVPAAAPHHQPSPGACTGFVFICPGRFEALRGYPCAAGTGANLGRALIVLNERLPARFASGDRALYVITNSWPNVEYPAMTGRSVPTVDEVLRAENLERLARELAGLAAVVACGGQAHEAVRALRQRGALRADVAQARHLSQRSVNMIPGASDTPGRIALWCEGVIAQLQGR